MRDWPPKVVPHHKRAVFLDRDGTINVDAHYPHRIPDLRFLPRSLEAMVRLSRLPVSIIVVTNQAGIALNLFKRTDMSTFNAALRTRVEQAGGRIDAFYFCPHLEAKNLPKGVALCACSKPEPGMLVEASNDFDLDLTQCFLVGDKTSDIAAGERAGCTTILVMTGKGGNEEGALPVNPKHVVEDLFEATRVIETHL